MNPRVIPSDRVHCGAFAALLRRWLGSRQSDDVVGRFRVVDFRWACASSITGPVEPACATSRSPISTVSGKLLGSVARSS
jgi:hypothetical protein